MDRVSGIAARLFANQSGILGCREGRRGRPPSRIAAWCGAHARVHIRVRRIGGPRIARCSSIPAWPQACSAPHSS